MRTASRTRPERARPESLQSVLASSARPPRPSALSTSLTFAWRGMLKIKHVPEQLFDVTLTPILFTVMFTYLFVRSPGRRATTCSSCFRRSS